LVCWNNILLPAETEFLSENTWKRNTKCSDEQDAHDHKGKDPLESDSLREELTHTQRSCQDAQCEAHGVVLVHDEEKQAIDEDAPDGNVGQDTSRCRMRVDRNRTIPVQCNKSPCKWTRYNGNVDESWMCVVAEIKGGQVEEVDNQDDLGPDKMPADEEHDKRKLQEVIEDEVASNPSSRLNMVTVLREEVPQVSDLKEEDSEPVERGNESVQSKACWVSCIMSPDGISPMLLVIHRHAKGVIDTGDDGQEPCDDGQDLVRPNGLHIVGLASGERVRV